MNINDLSDEELVKRVFERFPQAILQLYDGRVLYQLDAPTWALGRLVNAVLDTAAPRPATLPVHRLIRDSVLTAARYSWP